MKFFIECGMSCPARWTCKNLDEVGCKNTEEVEIIDCDLYEKK